MSEKVETAGPADEVKGGLRELMFAVAVFGLVILLVPLVWQLAKDVFTTATEHAQQTLAVMEGTSPRDYVREAQSLASGVAAVLLGWMVFKVEYLKKNGRLARAVALWLALVGVTCAAASFPKLYQAASLYLGTGSAFRDSVLMLEFGTVGMFSVIWAGLYLFGIQHIKQPSQTIIVKRISAVLEFVLTAAVSCLIVLNAMVMVGPVILDSDALSVAELSVLGLLILGFFSLYCQTAEDGTPEILAQTNALRFLRMWCGLPTLVVFFILGAGVKAWALGAAVWLLTEFLSDIELRYIRIMASQFLPLQRDVVS